MKNYDDAAKVVEALRNSLVESANLFCDYLLISQVSSAPDAISAEVAKAEVAEAVEEAPKKKRGRKSTKTEETPVEEKSLEDMSFSELKEYAESKGIPSNGSREAIISRLNPSEEDMVAPVTEVIAFDDVAPFNTEETPAVEPVVEEVPEYADDVEAKVMEAVKDMSDEEILDFLTDAGIKARGKRQALISAVVKAVRAGKIEIDDSEDEESATVDSTADSGVDPYEIDLSAIKYDARKAVVDELLKDTDYDSLDREDLVEALSKYVDTDTLKDKEVPELVKMYKYFASFLIDDEGNIIEEEGTPYYVDDEPYCCGMPLQLDDNGMFVCSVCGSSYEAE